MRHVQQVVDEIAADDQPYAVFVDNNLGSRPAYLRELCRALRPLQKIWSAALTIDVTDDHELVREMALAGCTGVFIGFEWPRATPGAIASCSHMPRSGGAAPRLPVQCRRIWR